MTPPPRILVVDDDRGVRTLCADLLTRSGYEVVALASAAEGLVRVREADFDLVLADINMPEMDGIELCRRLGEVVPELPVVLITAFPSIENAIRGMKEGAKDYVTKPFTPDELRIVVARALEERVLRDENEGLRRELRSSHGVDAILGASPPMRALCVMVRKVARSGTTVLIQGESGTGKELFARALHVHSERAARPFVAVNCGSLVGTLLESELFGHEKGAFTGAQGTKVGLATAAHRGTLFLDEIGELALDMQPKLLRLLQEGEVKPVGSVETKRVDVRVVAATNRDLRADVDAGRFREDLFYRLNVIRLDVPPLRGRLEDIPLLVDRFVRDSAQKARKRIDGVTREALAALAHQRWPGNVRELQNVVERAVILSSSEVLDVEDLLGTSPPGSPAVAASGPRLPAEAPYPFEGLTLDEVEQRHIQHVMARAGGQKSRAAECLGINRTTLWKKLRRYDAVDGEELPDEGDDR
ncbi:MAG: sigma-54-dependent Fis family transcriptional regulator [Deltaproteobacteria bacterium]|nr:sigma-54-dependent Fis family transcriptional regulator [Deltaproteobacteria bacterium]